MTALSFFVYRGGGGQTLGIWRYVTFERQILISGISDV